MNLHKKVITGVAALLLTGFANLSMAVPTISLDPNPVLGDVGDSVFVDLVWDSTVGATRYMGAWDLNVGFDDTVLDFVGAAFDPQGALGANFPGFVDFGTSVDLFDLSLSPIVAVRNLQDALGNVFVLATLEFNAVGVGDTDFILTGNSFASLTGRGITPVLQDGQASVGAGQVPEPGILSLVGLGLFSLAYGRRRLRA